MKKKMLMFLAGVCLVACGETTSAPIPRVEQTTIPRVGEPVKPAVRGTWARLDPVGGAMTFYRFHDEEKGVTCYLVYSHPPVCFNDMELFAPSQLTPEKDE